MDIELDKHRVLCSGQLPSRHQPLQQLKQLPSRSVKNGHSHGF